VTTRITVYGCGPEEAPLFGELAPRLGIAPTITEAPADAENAGLALGARCVSVSHRSPVGSAVLHALREAGVRYVSTRSIGVDHVDVECAERLGITVGNVAYSPGSVADFTLMLILRTLRDAHGAPGRELRDLTVGVVGTGRIGAAVVDRLHGFGCEILAHDPRPATRARYVPLDDLLARSDVVTLHTPLTADTHRLIDRRRLGLMPRGAVLVNTGRGAVVDTEALIDALEAGRLGGAALDVVEREDGLERLRALPGVNVTPHVAYFTDRAVRDAVECSLANCRSFDRAPAHV
jgi:D-specific alpha-keto acid dehydrogenase